MKKKTIRKILALFLVALCIMFTKIPSIPSPTSEDSITQVMPLSDMEENRGTRDN